MTGLTPVYSIPYPTGSDDLADLGEILQEFAQQIEATIAAFGGVAAPSAWATIPGYAGSNISGYTPVQYSKTGVWVELRGAGTYAAGWSPGGIFGTLPAGSRPLGTEAFEVYTSAGAQRVEVLANGQVVAQGTAGAGGSFSLSGIRFRVD